ncbi:MAG: transglutaminase family protein, partial [Chromatiales bacterium]
MHRYRIFHRTSYSFPDSVTLGTHYLRLRPREDYEVRIESSSLNITPQPKSLLWHRDVEGNSVATAIFTASSKQLLIESEVFIQHYNEAPLDFLVADYAINYPFNYATEDRILLEPYMVLPVQKTRILLDDWIGQFWQSGDEIQTYSLLQRLASHIHENLEYRVREEPGVQTPGETLSSASGSCRDFATLFMEAARCLGLAARFVSGYLHNEPAPDTQGATHAWTE